MKNRVFIALCLVASLLMLALAGCSGKPADSSTPDSSTPQNTTPQVTEPPATEPPVTEPPATDPPATEPPATEPPATEPPATEPDPTEPPAGDKGAAVAAKAQSLIGKPFKMGGIGPDEFDNSGCIYYCFKESGVAVPRLTGDLYKAGTAVEKADLKPGDVVFFYMDTEGAPQFAGIYVGNQKFISCNNENSPTKEQDMSWPYYVQRFVGARRYA